MKQQKREAKILEVSHYLSSYLNQSAEAEIRIYLSANITPQELKAAIEEALRKLVNNELP